MATEEQHPVSNSISPPSASLSLSPAANAAQDQEAEDLAPLQTHPDLLDDHGQDQGAATPPKATPSPSKRGRGRPRGSCNKKKSEMTYPGAKKASPVKKRGRGRPPKKGREEIVRPQLLTPSSGFPQTLPPPSSTEVLQSPVNFLAHPAFYESDPLEEDLSGPGPDESSSHEDPSQDSSSAAENNGPPGAPETLLQDNVAPNNNEPGPMPHQPVLPKRPSLSRVQQSNSSSSAESSRTNSPSQARPVRGGGRGRGRPRGRPRGSGRASTIQRQENNTSSGKLEDVMEEAITPEKAVNGVSPSSTGKLGRGRPLAGNYTTPTATPPMKVKSRWRRSSEMEQNHSEEDEKPAPIPNNNSGGINEQLLSHPAMDWNRKARIQLKQLSPNTLSSNILAPSTTPITTLASATSSSNSLLTTTLSTPPSSSLRPRTNRRRLSRSPSSSPESRSRSISPRRRKGSQKIEDSAGEEDEDWKKNDHINSLPETKAEIKARLESFQHIRENNFLCER